MLKASKETDVPKLTNKTLSQLLVELGFQRGQLTAKNNRVWTHPESRCVLFLPNNKVNETPRPGDVVGTRTQLDMHGHLDEIAFDAYFNQGLLAAPRA